MRTFKKYSLALVLTGVLVAVGCAPKDPMADSWPQWRGPGGLGISDAADLPVYWDKDGSGIKWSAEVGGIGTSSPIVIDDRVYLTSAKGVDGLVVLEVHSFDQSTGERHWATTIVRREVERTHQMSSPAGPTPVSDGTHIFAYFGSHLAALDVAGNVVWNKEIDPAYLKESRYGAGSSLVLVDDLLVVLRDRERVTSAKVGWIAAYDKTTGDQAWRRDWDDTCCSYMTPLVLERAVGPPDKELVVVLAGYVLSLDPKTGEIIRRKKEALTQPVASPVAENNLVCVASGAHSNREAVCWEVAEKGEKLKWKPLWRYAKWVPDTASPILLDGRLYLLTEKGILRAVNANTGRLIWQKRLERTGYRASLLAGAGRLYAIGESGATSVVSPEDGETIAVNQLPESVYLASPAVSRDCLLIRSESHLYCVDGTDEPSAETG